MVGDTITLLKLVAFLIGVVSGALAVMLVLLVISIFHEIGLTTGFCIQFVAAGISGAWTIWRTS